MANELVINYPTGNTLYALLFDATGQVWNGSAFEAVASANWTNYDIAMSEVATATGVYLGTMPAAAAGVYGWTVRKQAGGSPAVSDVAVGTGRIEWSGTAEIMPASTTNITAGTITTVTNLTNLPAAAALEATAQSILEDTGTTLPGTLATIAGYIDTEVAAILAAVDTEIAAILADTNELQTDLVNGGRLDLLIDAIKAKTDNLPSDPADQSAVEAAITAATSGLATAANLATLAGYVDTEVAAILADTNELQTDWANGGRLDLLVDAIKAKTDNLPSDPADQSAVESAITSATSGLSTLDEAGVRTAVGLGAANLDTQLGDLPTASEIDTELTASHGAGNWTDPSGAGTIAYEYSVTTNLGAPVSGARVVATTDEAGLNKYAEVFTDEFGIATFHLTAGDWYFWVYYSGYRPPIGERPDHEVVA